MGNFFQHAGWYPDEPKSKELELVRKPAATESGICPATRKILGPSDPICEKRNNEVTTAGYKTNNEDEKRKRTISSFTSAEKKKQDNSASEAVKKRHTSFDSYVNWKPAEGNWTTYGLHLEIPVTDKTFLQIFTVEIALILILLFSLRYYILEMKSLKNSVSEIMARAQRTAYSIADRIAQEGFMRSNFQNLLTAESLFRLGQVYYYQKNRNSGNSNLRDVKVNIGVQVGGQEITLPKSKTEKREDTSH
ncbi:hypothetical protein HNY73_002863 [Argiope bruennichi]|uniref:Uncharacterized protein n=1 Tax=Argiope bruennichi TaxID=94029 RepID=A0A8T0FW39_ARGBR|nr:hypothetical protein HNY73_002863 [Argiope bruennichi]